MQKHFDKLNTIIPKIGVAAILLVIPLFPKFPFINVPGTFVSIRLEDFVIFLVLSYWIFTNKEKITSILKLEISKSFILFIAVGLVSILSAVFVTKTVLPHLAFLHWFRRIEYISLFFVGLTSVKGKSDLAFYIKCIAVVISIAFIYGFGQKYFDFPIVTTQNQEYSKGIALRYTPGGHLPSTFAGHYDLATYIVFVSPIFYSLLFIKPEKFLDHVKVSSKQKILFRAIVLGIILASFWLLIQSVSRISILSYVGSVSLALVMNKKYKFVPIVIVFTLILSGLSGSVVSRYSRIIEVTRQKLNNNQIMMLHSIEVHAVDDEQVLRRQRPDPTATPTPVFEDRSTSIRLDVEWPRAIRAFMKNPMLGSGLSSITLATDNDYLRLAGELGMAGLLAFFALLSNIFNGIIDRIISYKRNSLNTLFLIGVLSGFCGILINAVFIDIFEASKFAISFWLIIGISFSLNKKLL